MSRYPNMVLGGPPIYQDYFNRIDGLSQEILELSERIDSKNEELTDIINNLKTLSNQANEIYNKITQLKLSDDNKIISESQQKLANAAVLYVSLLVGIISITLVWIFTVVGMYDWVIALALTFIILFFIFVLVVVYKYQSQQIINNELSQLNINSEELEQNIVQQTQKIAEVKTIIDKKGCGCNNKK